MSSYLSLTRLPGNRQLARLRQLPIPVVCSLRQRPPLVRAAVAGEQLELGAVAAGGRVVEALAEDPQLAVGREHPALRRGSVAPEEVDRVPVGGAAVEVVDALAGEAPDRAARWWRRRRLRGQL